MRRALPLFAFLALASCDRQDSVRRYRVPKDPSWRILGAIVPDAKATWFFKVWGASDRLGEYREEFLLLIRSLRRDGEGLAWTLPGGWTQNPQSPSRVATLRFGRQEPTFTLSVTQFPGDGGGVQSNIDRWREQVGMEADPNAHSPVVDVGTLRVTIVDLVGPRRPEDPPTATEGEGEDPSRQSLRKMFQYEAPGGWEENPHPGPNRVFEFRAGRGEAVATLSVLAGAAGGIAPNINRWREQVGLTRLEDSAAADLARPARFLDSDGWRIELVGKERAILCTFVLGGEMSIFLKFDGAPEAVALEKENYVRLCDSIHLKH